MNYGSSRDLNLMHPEQKKALAAALASPNQKANPAAAAGAPRPPEANIRELIAGNTIGGQFKHNNPGGPYIPKYQRDQAAQNANRPLVGVTRPGFQDDQGGGPPPFITQGSVAVPNPAFGKYHGMEWNGSSWVNLPPNADLEREAMEIQLEEMRRNARGNPDLRSWLQGRMERK
jgi:hypothetical protein